MTKEEFCERFVKELMTYAPVYDGPVEDLRAYAEEMAELTWAEEDQRAEGPEECARTDFGYWEQDQ